MNYSQNLQLNCNDPIKQVLTSSSALSHSEQFEDLSTVANGVLSLNDFWSNLAPSFDFGLGFFW